ncbi:MULTISPECIES: hypothetical protein [Niastella]|uniref:Arrestin-like N-terminal domain-containing protein n=1 Tax=Niastella soli TaxID=2821487 RepID=A0ABS3YRQ8_9BACT|nr:hypothetical protein [Niastella soli]MBO9200565.1 hypothetical protein [Niastella soli]
MKKKHVDVDLTFTITGNKLLAHLVFSNNTPKKLWVNKFFICYMNRIRRNLFKIVDDRNGIVKYRGPVDLYVSERNYLPLYPGETIESSIVLNEVYEMKRGVKYTIQYWAIHPVNYHSWQINRVASVPIEVIY